VFGGTGSVGSLIVEHLMTQDPYSIRVFCNNENELWEAKQKWDKMFIDEWQSRKLRYLLGDIRNVDRVKRALKGVDFVFNCAAIKHVPFAEYNPMEAVDVNIKGLENVIDGCVNNKVKKLLHISTDKAVEPTTIMGASKMIGERLLQERWKQNPTIQITCVRSGNIWNSRGSLIRLVEEYKKTSEPIPITDKKMRRYFIQPEALLQFIMLAFKEGKNGEIWVPKLQEISIIEAIRKGVPEDYPLIEIGIRKGEKLSEKLISETEINIKEFDTYWVIENE
jgi:FlaA1/EpsC-like NDP-sugar epimerase